MVSKHEAFWGHPSYAVVGHTARARYPLLTYRALKDRGKRVVPIDPEADTIEGDKALHSLAELGEPVDGLVIEVPREETRSWVEQAAAAGIKRVWIHMNRDTPEALSLAREKGIEVCTGTCAVQYLTTGFSPHAIHRTIRKILGRY
ncbi:MAG: CoA-binding protein [Deltaproteobacteria bacterium]|nr:CoA-binding protein [Deltaproteobacteria bacterium]